MSKAMSPNQREALTAESSIGNHDNEYVYSTNNALDVNVITGGSTVPSAIYNGQKTSTGTAVAISTSQALSVGLVIQALSTNVDSVYVGNSSLTTGNGFELQAGQATGIAVSNLDVVYVISVNSGDGICYVGS